MLMVNLSLGRAARKGKLGSTIVTNEGTRCQRLHEQSVGDRLRVRTIYLARLGEIKGRPESVAISLNNIIMKNFISLLIGCSLALAGAALAQQPVEQQSPSKNKRAPEKTHAAGAQPGANAAKP